LIQKIKENNNEDSNIPNSNLMTFEENVIKSMDTLGFKKNILKNLLQSMI
jgi:hypothetical protein